MTNHAPLKPGDQFHLLGTLTIPVSHSYSSTAQRGATITVTEEMLAAAQDRNGNSFLDLVDDEAGQVAKWGKVLIARGPAPEDVQWWNGGNEADLNLARLLEQENLKHYLDPAQRAEEAARIKRTYGSQSTSWSLGRTRD